MENFFNKIFENSSMYWQQNTKRPITGREKVFLGGALLIGMSIWPILNAYPIPGWRQQDNEENAMEKMEHTVIVS